MFIWLIAYPVQEQARPDFYQSLSSSDWLKLPTKTKREKIRWVSSQIYQVNSHVILVFWI